MGVGQLISTLEAKFPEAAKYLRKKVEDAIDEEFGTSAKPFPLQLFCQPVDEKENRFTLTISAPGIKLNEDLTLESLSSLDSAWVAFSERTASHIIGTLKRQTPAITDKAPD